MCPVLFTIGDKITIYGYGLMMALGMVACVAFACWRCKKKYAINPDLMFNIAVIGIIAGVIGSKLLYWIVEIKKIIADPKFMLNTLTSGFVIYGGLIGGVLAPFVYVTCIKKDTFMDKFDIAVASVALAQAFGRVGCFLAGCCYGKPIPDGAWYSFIGVTFPETAFTEAPAGVLLIPTQLISSGLNLLNFIFLTLYASHERFRGETSCLYIVFYAVGRFFIEYLRGDAARGTVGALSTSQFISIIIFVFGVVLWLFLLKKNGAPLRIAGEYKDKTEKKA